VTPSDLVAEINANRQHANLVRPVFFVLGFYRDQIPPLLSLSHTGGSGGNGLAPERQ
jgi:hypothetical protein